eukprot:jgi/Picre1/29230/NNA_004622.t1
MGGGAGSKEARKEIGICTDHAPGLEGGVSGGTIASGLEIAADPENRKKDLSPYAFIPEGETKGEDKDVWVPKTHMGVTLAPTIMQAINTRVVQEAIICWIGARVHFRTVK